MNLADIFTPDDIHHGFGKFDDLGVGVNYDMYQTNVERADAKQQQPCNHCGRGLNPDTCYLAIYAWHRQAFISVSVDHDALMSFIGETRWTDARTGETRITRRPAWSWVFLGSECAKNLPAGFKMLLRDFAASKWHGTPAHHEVNWGTW